MEKEDKIIKEFLEKGFFEKAPEGFTGRVMQAVEKIEPVQKQNWLTGVSGYVLIMLGAIVAAFGIIFFFDNAFLSEYYQSFFSGTQNILKDFSNTGNYLLSMNTHSPYLGLLSGIFIVIIALLGIERLVFRKRNFAGIFIW